MGCGALTDKDEAYFTAGGVASCLMTRLCTRCISPLALSMPHHQKGTSRLYHFLRDDVQPRGQRMLLASLTGADRLRLSETCRELEVYRHHLSNLLVRHPFRRLPTFLEQQKVIRVLDLSKVHLKMNGWTWILDALGPGLMSFTLPSIDLGQPEEAGRALGDALRSGRFGGLQRLDTSRVACRKNMFGYVARALETGCCPALRWVAIPAENDACHLFAVHVLRTGACPKLEELSLPKFMGCSAAPVFQAIETGCCPNLTVLDLRWCQLESPGCSALVPALASAHCQKLRVMRLNNAIMQTHDLVSILRLVERGHLPNLTNLHLQNNLFGEEHYCILGRAIDLGFCGALRVFKLGESFFPSRGLVHVMTAIAAKGCPYLEYLNLQDLELEGQAVVPALAALPTLKRFSFGPRRPESPPFPPSQEDTTADIITALASACRQLRRLDASGVHMGHRAGHALVRAISAWPMLTFLDVSCNPLPTCVVTRLSSSSEAQLERLVINCVGGVRLDGLVEAASRGMLPMLEVLRVDRSQLDMLQICRPVECGARFVKLPRRSPCKNIQIDLVYSKL